jgi:hypothetical protein
MEYAVMNQNEYRPRPVHGVHPVHPFLKSKSHPFAHNHRPLKKMRKS